MTHRTTRMILGETLRAAFEKRLARGWVYLPRARGLRLDTPCLHYVEDRDAEPEEPGDVAARQGFPVEGLDCATIEDTADWARHIADPPPDELLLQSFVFYLENDAFLPLRSEPAGA